MTVDLSKRHMSCGSLALRPCGSVALRQYDRFGVPAISLPSRQRMSLNACFDKREYENRRTRIWTIFATGNPGFPLHHRRRVAVWVRRTPVRLDRFDALRDPGQIRFVIAPTLYVMLCAGL
jgi:hypothetical protein